MSQDTHIIFDKRLRVELDEIIQKLKASSQNRESPLYRTSRERSIVVTKLQEAVMWLGMDLKAINDENPGAVENPYPNSKDPTNTKIDPTAQGLKL